MLPGSFVRSCLYVACVLVLAMSGNVEAQNYPTRSITFIVPSTPGGPGDVSARLISERMSAALGQTIVIETIAGAGGTIGMARVARAAPDGYTLMVHQNGFAITPALYAKLNFDTAKDFVTVGLLNQSATYLVGREALPAKTFAELKAWVQGPGKPAKLAHPGPGTVGHLLMTMLVREIGPESSLVSYRGIAPAVNDLLGGHIDATLVAAAVATPLIKNGKLKPYATTASKRTVALPDVPTFGEVGLKDLEKAFWHALFAPAATPQPILDRLNAALRETLSDPKVQEAYAKTGLEAYPQAQWSLGAANAYVKSELEFWGKVVRDNNVKID